MREKAFEPLDEYERDLMESIEKGEWVSVKDRDQLIVEAEEYAKSTIRKDKRMNIRMSERDLRHLKIAALEEGVPYQTLVSMILHKYLSGKLREVE